MKTLPIFVAALCAFSVASAYAEPVSASGLFEKAVTAQRSDNLGSAILNYERAALLAPGDAAIIQNLSVAREKAGVSLPAISAWQRPAYVLGFDGLALLASASAIACGLLMVGAGAIPAQYRRSARAASAVFAAAALFGGSSLVLRSSELDRAVVLAANAEARIAPASSSAVTMQLLPGETVTPHESHGDFDRITTVDGRSGWVVAGTVEKVIK